MEKNGMVAEEGEGCGMKQQSLFGQGQRIMRYISVAEKDSDILEAINEIHLEGLGFDLDPTYSKGCFYKNSPNLRPDFRSDVNPLSSDVKKCDCRKLWLSNESVISIVFDPPFLFRNRKAENRDKMCNRFSYFKTFEELLSMYKDSLKEFHRVLQEYGILVFKCQDMTDGSGSRPFFDTHCKVIEMARDMGFSLIDIGILVKKNKIIRKAKKQGCLRKVHSYYLVFKKKNLLKKESK